MQVLLAAATPFELAPTIAWLEQHFEQKQPGVFSQPDLEIHLCITGIGLIAATWRLAGAFGQFKPDFALNAGIGGTLDPRFAIGDVVHVVSETLADLGVEDADGRFIDLFELGLAEADVFPFTGGSMVNPNAEGAAFLPKAHGITVNKASGSAASIAAIRQKYPDAQVESMEGGAFFFAALHAGVPFAEIRAISNPVEPRNRETWDLPKAIGALNITLKEVLLSLS